LKSLKKNITYTNKYLVFALLIIFISGCSHLQSAPTKTKDDKAQKAKVVDDDLYDYDESESDLTYEANLEDFLAGSPNRPISKQMEVLGVDLKNTQFDLPVVVNSAVESWVKYFTTRGRKHFEKYLERANHFVPYIDPILKKQRVPRDLVYLAMIESGFHNHAHSKASAVGVWQFIASTAKGQGLQVNWWVDERRDIEKSTYSAIKYLRMLYRKFGNWELAAAAYNAGENKIARAIKRYNSWNFWTLARRRYLKSETRNYIPKLFAAAIISKNRTLFGFNSSSTSVNDNAVGASTSQRDKISYQASSVQNIIDDKSVAAHQDAEVDDDTIGSLIEDEANISYSLDENSAATIAVNKKDGKDFIKAQTVSTPNVCRQGEVGTERLLTFAIQSPADLLKVARAAGLSYQTVKKLNPEILRWCTPPNKKTYKIKLPASVKSRFLSVYNHPAYPREVKFIQHKIRAGDTLYRISKRYGISIQPILELNGISKNKELKSGTTILLPMPNDRTRSISSLGVTDIYDSPRRRYKSKNHRSSLQKINKISYKDRKTARLRTVVRRN